MRKRNWHKYNQDLIKRGSITFFIDPKALTEKPEKNKRGRPRLFSHPLIHLLLVLKIQYRLTYRTLEDFAKSMLPHIQADIFFAYLFTDLQKSFQVGSSFAQALL